MFAPKQLEHGHGTWKTGQVLGFLKLPFSYQGENS
jgi:hypothetical protein